MLHLHLKVSGYHDNGNGTLTIEVPACEITPEAQKMLEQLFPNLVGAAFDLLNKEALLSIIATEADLRAPATKGGKSKPDVTRAY